MFAQASSGQALEELLKAVEKGDAAEVGRQLDRGLDPNTTDKEGNTILMMAARLGHLELASLLIGRKASVARQTPAGDTALLMASLGGRLEMAKLLVNAGAPVGGGSGWQPLHYAAFSGASDIVRFLIERGADKNAVAPNGYTPLMLAVRNGSAEAARVLLVEDADVGHRGPAGETALSLAQRSGDASLVELLKRAGAVR